MNGFSTEEDSHDGPPAPPFYGQSCCLIEDGERCGRSAGNASFSKRIQKSISQKKLKLDIDKSVRHLYICDFHKNFIQSVRNKRKRKTSDDGGESPDHDVEIPEVDLFQLQVNTLRRYKRHYKLQTRPGLNKAQLAEVPHRQWIIYAKTCLQILYSNISFVPLNEIFKKELKFRATAGSEIDCVPQTLSVCDHKLIKFGHFQKHKF
ncbi:hypothetical protein JZ751_023187 [Albula glossodonta]|uniref:Histone deacetylase complex subunit SAP30L n=1 Tax=Albula glossodonta TaxID=121402 RepID=A0A8T2PJI1_9TELE|nr:hypothetical protein JZ751_023187 [Albula glossodonta]